MRAMCGLQLMVMLTLNETVDQLGYGSVHWYCHVLRGSVGMS